MLDLKYIIELNGKTIGSTDLEAGDPPMGVVEGKMSFIDEIASGFNFFYEYCRKHNCPFVEMDQEHGFLMTQNMNDLKIFRKDGIEIKGVGCYVTGLEGDEFRITILGIPYPFYGEEFPNHVQSYESQFNDNN